MKKIVAINASPRSLRNTGTLVREAAKGAESCGAEIKFFDLYRLGKFSGCVACFGCKLPGNYGRCVCRDGLFPILEEIQSADALILGTPNFFGDVSSGFRALYERLLFQNLTYKTEPGRYSEKKIPVLLIMTSNVAEEYYEALGYDKMLEKYKNSLSSAVGPTEIMISGDTLQVDDYSKFDWTMFDPNAKKERHEKVFPKEKEKAFALGAKLIR